VILSTVVIAGTYKQPLYVNPAPRLQIIFPREKYMFFIKLIENSNLFMEYCKAEIHKIYI